MLWRRESLVPAGDHSACSLVFYTLWEIVSLQLVVF
jgi:hypothetical protein